MQAHGVMAYRQVVFRLDGVLLGPIRMAISQLIGLITNGSNTSGIGKSIRLSTRHTVQATKVSLSLAGAEC